MAIAAAPGCGFDSNSAKPGPDGGGVDTPDGPGDDGGPPPDGSPSGNGVCYGPSGWQVCLDGKATGPVQLQGTLDTDKSDAKNPCSKNQPSSWTSSQPAACIIAGDTVTIASLSVTGSRPLVLVAQTSITVTGLLDVASHRDTGAVGAGAASSADCKPFGSAPGMGPPGGGGAGGGFMVPGGDGGPGNGAADMSVAAGKAASAQVGAPARLHGGCSGQPGGGGNASDGGAGGGAVYLVSAGTISIPGQINVSGAGGKGRDALHGGGGGGSGGMIALHAASTPTTTTAATILLAGGGGGGGGSSGPDQSQQTAKGVDGHDPVLATPIAPALGGTGGTLASSGFNGGDGGQGYPVPADMLFKLTGLAADTGSGGGGGGGGGGHIRSNQALGTAVVSPPAVPWP
jgi:hypothetical protein